MHKSNTGTNKQAKSQQTSIQNTVRCRTLERGNGRKREAGKGSSGRHPNKMLNKEVEEEEEVEEVKHYNQILFDNLMTNNNLKKIKITNKNHNKTFSCCQRKRRMMQNISCCLRKTNRGNVTPSTSKHDVSCTKSSKRQPPPHPRLPTPHYLHPQPRRQQAGRGARSRRGRGQ